MRIPGAVAVVTGASSGIGRAVAVELAARGATVVGVARRELELERTLGTCRRHQPASFALVADVAVPADCRRVGAEVGERLGRADILVNNAGIPLHRDVRDTSPEDVEAVMRVNFLGPVHLTARFLPGMLERRRGSIVNVGSVAGQVPNPKEAAYGASKAALAHWTHGLAVDLHGSGVHVGLCSPGPIDTEIWAKNVVPSSYYGRKFPAGMVAAGVAAMIEKELVQLTVPRRFGAVGPLYGLPGVGRLMRRGLVGFEQAGQRRRRRA